MNSQLSAGKLGRISRFSGHVNFTGRPLQIPKLLSLSQVFSCLVTWLGSGGTRNELFLKVRKLTNQSNHAFRPLDWASNQVMLANPRLEWNHLVGTHLAIASCWFVG